MTADTVCACVHVYTLSALPIWSTLSPILTAASMVKWWGMLTVCGWQGCVEYWGLRLLFGYSKHYMALLPLQREISPWFPLHKNVCHHVCSSTRGIAQIYVNIGSNYLHFSVWPSWLPFLPLLSPFPWFSLVSVGPPPVSSVKMNTRITSKTNFNFILM